MFNPIKELLRKDRTKKLIFSLLCISLLSAYPIYKNFYNGKAVLTYDRHIALIEGRSEYYNPWQYRMLCPTIIEGLMWVYNHTVDRIYPVEEKVNYRLDETTQPTPETREFMELLQKEGAVKYLIIFVFFRFFLDFAIFVLAFCLWRYFVKSNWLVFLGLMFCSLAMGNAVVSSDLTFHSYMEILLYLLGACIIVYRKNPLWLIPVTILAAFNRETSIMIPLLFFVSQMNFSHLTFKNIFSSFRFPARPVWLLTSGLFVVFLGIFIGLRVHYGFRPPQVWKVPAGWPMLKLNLFSSSAVKSYFELLGALSVIPLILIYKFKAFPLLLKTWFLFIVPVWFGAHFYLVVAYQTRTFLMPLMMIFIPMLLWLVENGAGRKAEAKSVSVMVQAD